MIPKEDFTDVTLCMVLGDSDDDDEEENWDMFASVLYIPLTTMTINSPQSRKPWNSWGQLEYPDDCKMKDQNVQRYGVEII